MLSALTEIHVPRTRLFHAGRDLGPAICACVVVAVSACGGTSPGPGGGGGVVSFRTGVLPVIQAKCTQYCHLPGASPMVLGADFAHQSLVNAPSVGCTDKRLRVAPGKVGTQDSYLMAKLLGVDLCGKGGPMPPNGPLTPDEIELIGAWVSAGAPNN